jgi:TatD DNase family protein
MTPPLIDIGANLGNKAFREDLDAVLARAASAGLEAIVVTGTSVPASRDAWELAERARTPGSSPRLFATAGIHPHHGSTYGPDARVALRELCARPEVVAVGECGLDFDRNFSPRAEQLRCFEAQLELAAELQPPRGRAFDHRDRARVLRAARHRGSLNVRQAARPSADRAPPSRHTRPRTRRRRCRRGGGSSASSGRAAP